MAIPSGNAGARGDPTARRPRRMRCRTTSIVIGRSVSIVENRKAFHDYFIEERFEAGIALEGWEVKAIRGGRANLKEAYVVVKNGELMLIGAHISPLTTASTHVSPDPTRTRRAAAASRGDQPADRQGRARRLHADADRPALQQGPRQAGDRPCEGQEAARQARGDQGSRVEPRAAADHARPQCASSLARDGLRHLPARTSVPVHCGTSAMTARAAATPLLTAASSVAGNAG